MSEADINKATARPWVTSPGDGELEACARFSISDHVLIFADHDCEAHPFADCSCSHTCRTSWEQAVNAALIARAVNSYDAMLVALKSSKTAIDDWLNTYASDLCDETRVTETFTRIADFGGTLAYIAAIRDDIEAAIRLGEGKGETM